MIPRVSVGLCVLAACGTASGSLDLELSLPPPGDLRPAGMTTVGITETKADGSSSVTTTALQTTIAGTHFAAGEVAAGEPITLAAELRDASNRLVGFGAISNPVTPSGTDDVSVTIPVRKPIVYVASDVPVSAIDPTRDNLDPKYQSALTSTAVVVVPVDGTEIAVVTATGVQRFATATHAAAGKGVALSFGTPLDAAGVPGQRRLVIGTTSGIAIVDVDAGTVSTINGQRADRVAVGVVDGTATAFALSNRVLPAMGATGMCSGTSTVYSVAIDSMGAPMQIATGTPLADIAADGSAVFGANPCAGQVKRLDPGGTFSMALPGAAALAVASHQLWAAGSTPAQSGAMIGSHITLASSALNGTGQRQVALAPKSEIITYDGDQAHELSIFLHADTEVPVDLVVLPHADQVAMIARMDTHRAARFDSFGKVIPEMQASVWDVLLADPVSGSTTRIRAMCDLMVIANSDAEFPDWSCAEATAGEAPAGGMYTPAAIGAVYGDR